MRFSGIFERFKRIVERLREVGQIHTLDVLPAWLAGYPDHGATRRIAISLGVPLHSNTRYGRGSLTMGAMGQSMHAEDGR